MTIDNITATIEYLKEQQIIPKEGLFDITEYQLQQYIKAYGLLFASANRCHSKNFARKLAGLNLLKTKLLDRGASSVSCKEGILYLIGNPAWPDHLKIGITTNIDNRLSTYQTGDPFRAYSVKHYEFVLDRRIAEKYALSKYNVNIEAGEWVSGVNGIEMIKTLRNLWYIPSNRYTV